MTTQKRQQGYEAIAKGLREFGYPDATAEMVAEIHAAMQQGKAGADLPHGIIGRFAEGDIEKHPEIFGGQS